MYICSFSNILGNTVRRVFKEPEFLADQIGASVELVNGLINIWIAMKENLVLDPQLFYEYCQKSLKVFRLKAAI